MKYSLIIPCYNEEKNIPLLIDQSKQILKNDDYQLILVDNGSTDNSRHVLKKFESEYRNLKIINIEKNQGYGYGILEGLKNADGNILGWTHADLQTDPKDFMKGVEIFEKFGNKIFVKGKRYGRPFGDTFFTIGMSIFESTLLGKKLWDINAQPTIFTKEFFDTLNNPPNDFSLDLYFYYSALKSKLKVHRFPVSFGERAFGTSHWNIDIKSKIKFIKRTINYSFNLRKNL